MAQEVVESVDVVYCGNCSMPCEYCRYNEKNTYNLCLKWLKMKKQKNLLEHLLNTDEELAADIAKLSLDDQKQSESTESPNDSKNANKNVNDNENDNDANEEKTNPHDRNKKPSKSILKNKDESDENENENENENESESENNNSNEKPKNKDNDSNEESESDENEDSNEMESNTNRNKSKKGKQDDSDDEDPLLKENYNRSIGIGRNVGRGGKGRRQKGRKGGKKGKKGKGQNDDSDSEDESQLTGKQLKEKQRQKRREELAKNAMVPEEQKKEQAKAEQAQKREKMKADNELQKSKNIIVIGSKKIKGGKVVTHVTGLVELGMKPKRAQSEFRKQFATGVGVGTNEQGKTEIVIQGEHRYDLMKFLREKFGTPAKLLFYQTRDGLEPGYSPEGMLFPPGM